MIIFKSKRQLQNIENMIDDAIDQRDILVEFDETLESSIMYKFKQYIHIQEINKERLSEEKESAKQLISDISHQTKTPIANLLLYTDLLLEEESLKDSSIEIINEIKKQSDKLNFLVKSLVKSSRLETGIIQLLPKENNLNHLILDIIDQLEQKIQMKEMKINYMPTSLITTFDYKWTGEALHNILENAIKYSKKATDIKIYVEKYEMFCRINIEDKGRGIKESELNKIFARFYRSIDVVDVDGVGIGLYLARRIIEEQSGYIKVYSKINEGSKFSVFLPL